MLDAFQETFEQTVGVNGYKTDEDYSAFFTKDGIKHRVAYNAQGDIVSAIRYCDAQHLPFFVKAKITKRFNGKDLYGVTEMTADGETVCHIILTGAKSWMAVRADNRGNTRVEEKRKRSGESTDTAVRYKPQAVTGSLPVGGC